MEEPNRSGKRFTIVLIVLLALLVGWIAYSWWQNRYNDWRITLHPKHKTPYGAFVFAQLLEEESISFVYGRKRMAKTLHEKVSGTGNLYVFLGTEYFPSSADLDSLLAFVGRGNEALILSSLGYQTLNDTLKLGYDGIYDLQDSTARAEVKNKRYFQFTGARYFDTIPFFWSCLKPKQFRKSSADVLGGFVRNDSLFHNFLRIPFGKGKIYLHTEPLLFSNYFLLHPEGYGYASAVFGKLSPPQRVYWDEASTRPDYRDEVERPPGERSSPLQFILSQRGLAWGYYSLLVLVFLFVLFRGKRKQRVQPILKQEENTSLEFTKTIGQLYYQQKDHRKLAAVKYMLFLDFIRSHYYISATELNQEVQQELLLKSQVPKDELDALVSKLHQVTGSQSVSESELIQLHQQLEHFYQTCK